MSCFYQFSPRAEKTQEISRAAAVYYRDLRGREHDFPHFPISAGNVPDASPETNQLRRVVRMGQTNFQFANIWEHRRTRDVMIAGFRTLGDAINNLESTVENSIANLESSFSSDVARVVEQGIEMRDLLDRRTKEQSRMLDNIQHRRR